MQNRRNFFKKAGALAASIGTLPALSGAKTIFEPAETPKVNPSVAQQQWMDLKFGMFIHFGINTYYDVEWSDGTLDPSKYNPKEINTDRWIEVAKAAGMKYVVIVTKHHDGFCNFNTKYTDYSVKSTPFKKDVVKMVADSCAKYGLKFGIYYSLWDRHEKTHDANEVKYVDFMKNQLTELLTGYGPVVEIWFDGFWKKQRSGWKDTYGYKPSYKDFYEAWRSEGAYRWQMDSVYQHIKTLQPDCLVMNNPTTEFPGLPLFPVDIRAGEKYTAATKDKKVWTWLGEDKYLPLQIETTMSQKGKDSMFESGSWFWHEWDHSVATKEQIKEWLKVAEKQEANLLLNVGPMSNGRLRSEDEQVLLSLNK